MTVQHEIKSQLAKLLATEDLIVEHKQVETAKFNVGTRVLTLPLWEKASNTVYDMLVGHEVGHALFTPNRDWYTEIQIPPQFVNIVEDVSIEKLMNRKYAGLSKSFYHGYEELNDDDFFGIEDEDLTTLNLADRINLEFKIGNFIRLPFTIAEQKIVDLVDSCQTFDDVLKASKVLYDFCAEQDKEKKEQVSVNDEEGTDEVQYSVPSSKSESSDDVSDDDSEKESDNSVGRGQPENQTNAEVQGQQGSDSTLGLKTVQALEDSLKDLTDTQYERETAYFEVPKLDLNHVIIPNETIHEECRSTWDVSDKEYRERYERYQISMEHLPKDRFANVDGDYIKFKRNAQKEVNYLVKEFECRKAASSYARATTSRTGVLDTAKLHTYKYSEDLFKKISVVPDGKNHGLVFILDWSGSMNNVMMDTLKQLYNLIWFCKKVNIPFDVYAFTNSYPRHTYDSEGFIIASRHPAYEPKEGLAHVEDNFSLMHFFSSKVRTKVLEEQLKNIFRVEY